VSSSEQLTLLDRVSLPVMDLEFVRFSIAINVCYYLYLDLSKLAILLGISRDMSSAEMV